MRRIAVLALLAVAAAGPAAACGHCIEDKIAAAYDHAEVGRALQAKHAVAFFGIDGLRAGGEPLRQQIMRALEATPGVDRGSARVSLEGASLSFAFDPARVRLAEVSRAAERRLAAQGLTLLPLRVMDRMAELKPATAR